MASPYDSNLTERFQVRIDPKQKARVRKVCKKHRISEAKLMRVGLDILLPQFEAGTLSLVPEQAA